MNEIPIKFENLTKPIKCLKFSLFSEILISRCAFFLEIKYQNKLGSKYS